MSKFECVKGFTERRNDLVRAFPPTFAFLPGRRILACNFKRAKAWPAKQPAQAHVDHGPANQSAVCVFPGTNAICVFPGTNAICVCTSSGCPVCVRTSTDAVCVSTSTDAVCVGTSPTAVCATACSPGAVCASTLPTGNYEPPCSQVRVGHANCLGAKVDN